MVDVGSFSDFGEAILFEYFKNNIHRRSFVFSGKDYSMTMCMVARSVDVAYQIEIPLE